MTSFAGRWKILFAVEESSTGSPGSTTTCYRAQPLAFNLFGELSENLDLASAVLGDMTDGRVTRVDAVEFEWSPGRG